MLEKEEISELKKEKTTKKITDVKSIKVLSIILIILTCVAVIYDKISSATLLAVLAFYTGYQSDRFAK